MKTPAVILVACVLFVTAGCFHVPSPFAESLDPVVRQYGAVRIGSTRTEIETLVGAPTKREIAGADVWETRYDAENFALLKVWYDQEDRAQKIETTRSHGYDTPSRRAAVAVTRYK